MRCKDCEYVGIVFDHLRGFEGVDVWMQCRYPLPYHHGDKAVVADEDHECVVAVKKEGA